MESAIVTVRSHASQHSYDLEVPLNLPAEILSEKIISTVTCQDRQFVSRSGKYKIKVEHLGRVLQDDETLEEAGVWEGSILTIVFSHKIY